MTNKKTLIMGITFIVLVVLGMIGLTYAFFTARVEGNEEASSTIVETADLRLVYDGTAHIEMNDALPGWSETKTFTVENKGNVEIEYTIDIVDLTNTFVNGELVYSLESTNGGAEVNRKAMPISFTKNTLATARIGAGVVQTYTIEVLFLETGSDQNSNQGAIFSGKIEINSKGQYSTRNLTLTEKILADNTPQSDEGINFDYASNGVTGCTWDGTNSQWINCTTDESKITNGLYKAVKNEVDEGIYYFRGTVENNYVIFGDYCWRIVRTNEDESVKLRYGGSPEEGSCPKTGTPVNVGTGVAFNTDRTQAKYVGYTYDDGSGQQVDSNTKTVVESWYETNIWKNGQNTAVTDLIADIVYCNDRTESVQTNGNIYYGAFNRLYYTQAEKNPTYVCEREEDRYTQSREKGNGLLKYPVGLLTADEMAYAGARHGAPNSEYYLYTSQSYWGMSPYSFYISSSSAYVWAVGSTGFIGYSNVAGAIAVVPVVSLKPETTVKRGTGLYNDPYVILID